MQTNWITMKQVQELLNYTSRNAVYKYMRTHGIRASKPQGKVYFNHADIMAALEEKAVKMGA